MKIQHLAVIFVIIIMPISLVLSAYLNTHISTIQNQTQYTTRLINATYDAAKAFQINTFNNRYSTLSNSKIRDIEASINTFYRTLGTNMGTIGYASTELQTYTPAILCTLYDGYYIYTKYYDTELDDYTYGLKPFISYSCRYVKNSNYDFVVNYTLDNTITVIGKVDRTYVTKSGHLVADTANPVTNGETLREDLIIINENNNKPQKFEYVIYGNEKIYKDNTLDADGKVQYFRYSTDYRKNYVSSSSYGEIDTFFNGEGKLSAKKYYDDAISFTSWVKSKLGGIEVSNAVDSEGNQITFASDIGDTTKIFEISSTNNPLVSSSNFNEHRMNVIRYSIQSNLAAAITNYSNLSTTGFEFAMPKIEEDEWDKIVNNVCFVTFLQGLPIGSKTYSNYCVVANNTNQETVGADSIYIIAKDTSTGATEYHRAGCKKLNGDLESGSVTIEGAYSSSDFERKSVSLTGSDANAHTQLSGTDIGDSVYFFPQSHTSCYDCIVNMSDTYSIDDVVAGSTGINITLRNTYLKALARCRYNLYTINGYFGS